MAGKFVESFVEINVVCAGVCKVIQGRNLKSFSSISNLLLINKGTSMYYVITKGGGGGQKMAIFDYVQY